MQKTTAMVESAFLILGVIVILFFFIKNTITRGRAYATSESRGHFSFLKIMLQTFVQVFMWGKKEKEIIDD